MCLGPWEVFIIKNIVKNNLFFKRSMGLLQEDIINAINMKKKMFAKIYLNDFLKGKSSDGK